MFYFLVIVFFLLVTVTSSWSMLLLLKPSKQSRTQMDTNSTSNTRLGSTSSLTLTSEYGVPPSKCIVQVLLARLGIQVNNRPFVFVLFFRYMNISDEWEAPAKQPFKDFVSVTLTFQS